MKKFAPVKSCSIRERRPKRGVLGTAGASPAGDGALAITSFSAATFAQKDCFCGAQKPAGEATALPRTKIQLQIKRHDGCERELSSAAKKTGRTK